MRGTAARDMLYGMAAGAAGTTVLNGLTYLDMALRGRPASTTPQETVRRTEEKAHLTLDGADGRSEQADNRRDGLGALLGIAAGVGVGAVCGLVRPRLPGVPASVLGVAVGAGANAGTVVPMVALGVTDPRTWTASSWMLDIVPHLAYGFATVAVRDTRRHRPRATMR
jgi:hypothetical protein